MANDYCIGQLRYRAFLSSQRVLLDSSALECYGENEGVCVGSILERFYIYPTIVLRMSLVFTMSNVHTCL